MRRTHAKSRRGCGNCKRRHVKCDEAAPQCGPCSKRSIRCDFAESPSPASHTTSPRSQDTPIPQSLSSHGDLNMADLELMHFYCTESYKSLAGFAGRVDHAYVLRWDTVPKLAFHNPVLMHALLSFSASHLRHITPTAGVYDQLVFHHKHCALRLMQEEISTLTRDCDGMKDGIVATSSFLACQTLSEFASSSDTHPNIEWIHLMRGTKAVLAPMWSHREQSIFIAEFTYKSPEILHSTSAMTKFDLTNIQAHLPSTYTEYVTNLANMIDPLFPEPHYSLPPLQHQEKEGWRFGGDVRQRVRDLFVWTVTLPDSFVSRVGELDPGILTLLVWCYGSMRELWFVDRDIWWIENIAREGVPDVMRFLRKDIPMEDLD